MKFFISIFISLYFSTSGLSQGVSKFIGDYDVLETYVYIGGPLLGFRDTTESYLSISGGGDDTLIITNFAGMDKVFGVAKSDSLLVPSQTLGPEDNRFVVSGKGKLIDDTLAYQYYLGGALIEGVRFCLGQAIKNVSSNFNLFKNNDRDLNCFPNPFKDFITIEYPSSEAAILEILSAHGKLVFKKELNNSGSYKINLSSLPAGIYLVKLKTGNKTLTEKILKT